MLAQYWPRIWRLVISTVIILHMCHLALAQNLSQSKNFAVVRTASPNLNNASTLAFGAPGDCQCNYGTILGFSMAANRGQPPK